MVGIVRFVPLEPLLLILMNATCMTGSAGVL